MVLADASCFACSFLEAKEMQNHINVRELARLEEVVERKNGEYKVNQTVAILGRNPRFFVRGECIDAMEREAVKKAYRQNRLYFMELEI